MCLTFVCTGQEPHTSLEDNCNINIVGLQLNRLRLIKRLFCVGVAFDFARGTLSVLNPPQTHCRLQFFQTVPSYMSL